MEKNEILVNFGRRLKMARENLNLTQQELADAVGITKSMISAYENGMTDPRMSIMKPLADRLKITIDWLATGETVVPVGSDPEKAKKIRDYIEFLEHQEKV